MTIKLSLDNIAPDPNNPRKTFSPESVQELANSIKEMGLIQPIVVRPTAPADKVEAQYVIVAGHRRAEALRILGKGSARCVLLEDVVVGDGTSKSKDSEVGSISVSETAALALIENIQRENLSPLEEASAFESLLNGGNSTADLARRLGLTQTYVRVRLQLLQLPERARELVGLGKLSLRAAQSLHALVGEGLKDQEIDAIAIKAAKQMWSAKQVEAQVAKTLRIAKVGLTPKAPPTQVVRPVTEDSAPQESPAEGGLEDEDVTPPPVTKGKSSVTGLVDVPPDVAYRWGKATTASKDVLAFTFATRDADLFKKVVNAMRAITKGDRS